jgi:AcrR family transcriptional regulator
MDELEAILKASLDLLCERGFGGLTMEGVAVRSQVPAERIHRQWRSRSDILSELLKYHSDEPTELPETPGLRADLTFVVERLVDAVHRLRVLVAVAMAEGARDPELALELRLFVFSWQTMCRRLVARAIERGELPATLDEGWAVDVLTSMVWFRILLVGDLGLQAAAADRLVQPILRAWGYDG